MISEILHSLFTVAEQLVATYGYLGIWAGMTIESAAIPLPSEAIMGLAGFFVSRGQLNLWLAALAGGIGNATGSTIMYVIGHVGGKPLVLKFGGRFGVSEDEFRKGEEWLKKYGDKAVFFAQLLPVVRTYVSLPPGVLRMNYPKFIFYTFTGAFIWCLGLAFAAQQLGANWMEIEKYMKGFQYVVIAGMGLAVMYLIYYKAKKQDYYRDSKIRHQLARTFAALTNKLR